MRCSAAGGFGPDVAPHTATRPSRAATSSDVRHVASPTCSTTTSAPRPPVASRTAALTSPLAWFTVASAPSSVARASFSSLDEVTIVCAPSAFAIARPAVETPPPVHLTRAGLRIGNLFEDEHLRAAVLVDPNRQHGRHTIHVQGSDLERLAEELGLDVVGAAPAEPYVDTERHIRERRARGLFADMKFTMAQPERSCHPETLLPGACTVI